MTCLRGRGAEWLWPASSQGLALILSNDWTKVGFALIRSREPEIGWHVDPATHPGVRRKGTVTPFGCYGLTLPHLATLQGLTLILSDCRTKSVFLLIHRVRAEIARPPDQAATRSPVVDAGCGFLAPLSRGWPAPDFFLDCAALAVAGDGSKGTPGNGPTAPRSYATTLRFCALRAGDGAVLIAGLRPRPVGFPSSRSQFSTAQVSGP
jgi:hypothetical protein